MIQNSRENVLNGKFHFELNGWTRSNVGAFGMREALLPLADTANGSHLL